MLQKSDYFILVAVLISFLLSVYLWFSGNHQAGIFVGLWVPSILSLGSYLKTHLRKGGNYGD